MKNRNINEGNSLPDLVQAIDPLSDDEVDVILFFLKVDVIDHSLYYNDFEYQNLISQGNGVLRILNLNCKLVIQRISLMIFKCSIGVLPLPVSAPFQYNSVIHTHNTRRNKFIHTPIGRIEDRTFSYRGAHIWNYISQNVPTDVSYVCFKNLVKTHILAHPIPHFRLNI